MPRRSISRMLRPLQTIPRLTTAILRAPFEALLVLVEWFIGDVVARLVILPVLLVYHVRRQLAAARQDAERKMTLDRAGSLTLALELAAVVRLRQFAKVVEAVEQLDRAHALTDPHFRESLETVMAGFEESMRQLRTLATDRALDEKITAQIGAIAGGKQLAA